MTIDEEGKSLGSDNSCINLTLKINKNNKAPIKTQDNNNYKKWDINKDTEWQNFNDCLSNKIKCNSSFY